LAGSSLWAGPSDFTVTVGGAPPSDASVTGAGGFGARGNHFIAAASSRSDQRALPARKTEDVDRAAVDPLRADVALSSLEDEAHPALASHSQRIQADTQLPTIDNLALLRAQRPSEDSHDDQDLIDGVLAVWPESKWWHSA
jgi:hypothetical protein